MSACPPITPCSRLRETACDLLAAQACGMLAEAARALVRERERRLKASQSRFANRAVLDRWGGASGAYRLSFRWGQAQSHLEDLLNGQ